MPYVKRNLFVTETLISIKKLIANKSVIKLSIFDGLPKLHNTFAYPIYPYLAFLKQFNYT